jgi:hypothetical protein
MGCAANPVGCFLALLAAAFLLPLLSVGGVLTGMGLSLFSIAVPGFVLLVFATMAVAFFRVFFGQSLRPRIVEPPPFPPPTPRSVTPADRMQDLQEKLPAEHRERSRKFFAQVESLLALLRQSEDEVTRSDSAEGLGRLRWVHLKLLVARAHLEAAGSPEGDRRVQAQAAEIREQLARAEMSPGARESRQATLAMLEERLRNMSARQCRLDEIASDLERIEAQVDLAAERAALHSGQAMAPFQIDLATRMVDDADYFGAVSPDVRAVDEHYGFRREAQ